MLLRLSKPVSDIINKYRSPVEEENTLFLSILHDPKSDILMRMKAREWLILHNLKIVIWIISNHYPAISVNHDDIFSIGVSGLIKAIDRFDVTKEKKLSVYAYWWIIKEVNRFLTKYVGLVRFPNNVTESKIASKMKKGKYEGNISQFKKDNPEYENVSSKSIENFMNYQSVQIDNILTVVHNNRTYSAEFDKLFKHLLFRRKEEINKNIFKSLNVDIEDTNISDVIDDIEDINDFISNDELPTVID
jgi:RNA polymerase sigma factor (sigma-70 family)